MSALWDVQHQQADGAAVAKQRKAESELNSVVTISELGDQKNLTLLTIIRLCGNARQRDDVTG